MVGMENLIPNWLHNKGELPMTLDNEVSIPKIATLPEPKPKVHAPPSDEPVKSQVDLTLIPTGDILEQAAKRAMQYETEKTRWTKLAEEAGNRIKDLQRECEFLRLEILETKNNMQVLQSQVEDFRQENSDLRAIYSEQLATLKHMATRLENADVLPIRKRTKNGHPKPVERPTNTTLTEVADALKMIPK